MCSVSKLYASFFQRSIYTSYWDLFLFFMYYIILGLGSEECGLVWERREAGCGLGLGLLMAAWHREKGWPICVAVWVRVRVSQRLGTEREDGLGVSCGLRLGSGVQHREGGWSEGDRVG